MKKIISLASDIEFTDSYFRNCALFFLKKHEFFLKKHESFLRKSFPQEKDVNRVTLLMWEKRIECSVSGVNLFCESPIEKRLAYTLLLGLFSLDPDLCCIPSLGHIAGNFDNEEVDKSLMEEVSNVLYGTDYFLLPNLRFEKRRVDFFVNNNKEPEKSFIIECDSFQYHGEKDQFAKDRKRFRELAKHKYPILTFTGSEIKNKNMEVFDEIISFMNIIPEYANQEKTI